MTSTATDRNLLFGILALQMEFISRDELVRGMSNWAVNKDRSLAAILVDDGALGSADRQLLDRLVDRQVELHEGDVGETLATLARPASLHVLRESMRETDAPEVQEALTMVSAQHAAPPDPEATLGTTLHPDGTARQASSTSRFRVVRPHAEGGLGRVSVAMDQELDREVALKEIKDAFADDEWSRSRFTLEAVVTGRLEHPGIVPVYGLGCDEQGRPFYAMRFIKGDSLQDACMKFHRDKKKSTHLGNSLEFRALLGRFVDVCNAIAYAHSRGILHRDIKPGNIMLGKYGETLVVDWGLAKSIERDDQWRAMSDEVTLRPAESANTPATQMGSALGTPAFMPPEQAAGQLDRLTPASDVYSLGATLYSLLTNRVPFEDQSLEMVLAKVQLGEFEEPSRVDPTIPKALNAVCLKAMAARPSDRFQNPSELAEDLQRWLGDEPVTAYEEPLATRCLRWVRRHQSLAASVTVLLFTVVIALVVSTILIGTAQRQTSAALSREKTALGESEQRRRQVEATLLTNRRLSTRLAFDRAITMGDAGDHSAALLWLARAMELAPEEDDSTHELIRANFAMWSHAPGSLVQQFARGGYPATSVLSRDGRMLYTLGNVGISLWDLETGQRLEEWPYPEPEAGDSSDTLERAQPSSRLLVLSGDGKTVAAAHGKRVHFFDTEREEFAAESLQLPTTVTSVDFRPETQELLVASQDGTLQIYDSETREALGDPMTQPPALILMAFFSFGGDQVVSVSTDGGIRRWLTEDATPVDPPLSNGSPLLSGAVSPDGRLLAIGDMSSRARIWDLETGEATELEFDLKSYVHSVSFSPDGESFAIGTGNGEVTIRDLATGRVLMRPLPHEGDVFTLLFHPTEKRLITKTSNTNVRVWELPEQALVFNPVQFLDPQDADAGRVCVHPDGDRIAIGSFRGGIQINEVATGRPIGERLDFGEPVIKLAFNADGDRLIVAGYRGTVRVYETSTWELVGREIEVEGGVRDSVFRDPDLVVTASMSDSIQAWNIHTGEAAGPEMRHDGVDHVAIVGDRLLSTSFKELLRWDLATGSQTGSPLLHEAQFLALNLNTDGTLFAGGDANRSAIVGSAETGRVRYYLRHGAPVSATDFSADTRYLLTGSFDYTARLWHVETGKRVGPVLRHADGIAYASLESDDSHVVSFDRIGVLYRWELPSLDTFAGDADQLRLIAEVTTGMALDERDAVEVLSVEEWRERRRQWEIVGAAQTTP